MSGYATFAFSDNEEETEKEFLYGSRDGLLFFVDATECMFQEDEREIPFITCMQCCRNTLLNKIIGSHNDVIGIVFFGTKKSNNLLEVDCISTFQDLMQPSAERIKEIDAMLKSDLQNFRTTYGSSSSFSLADGLWVCSSIFSRSHLKLAYKRIILMTCSDNPHLNSGQKQQNARVKANDLRENDIDLEIVQFGKSFDFSLFYKELIQIIKGEEDNTDWNVPDSSYKQDELLKRVFCSNHKKRSTSTLLFKLNENTNFGVSIYNLVRETKMPASVNLHRETNEKLEPSTKLYHISSHSKANLKNKIACSETMLHSTNRLRQETGEILEKSDISMFLNFGDRNIILKTDEIKRMRSMNGTGIVLLGFKPIKELKLYDHYKASSFIYPAENLVTGSRVLFAALLKRSLDRNVAPLCWISERESATPKLVLLMPQKEVFSDTNIQLRSPGFHVIYLPSVENVRELTFPKIEEAAPSQVDIAQALVKKLKFEYSPHKFDNPKLQCHWRNIETLAMGYEKPLEFVDYVEPNHERIKKKLGSITDNFFEETHLGNYEIVPGVKRKLTTSVSSEKKEKTSSDILKVIKSGKAATLTVAQLKQFMQEEGMKVPNKKKQELIDLIHQHLSDKQL